MAFRTTHEAVKDLLGDDFGPREQDGLEPSLDRWIRGANQIINRVVTCAADRGFTLTAEEKRELEMWLSAHMYTRSDPTYASETKGGGGGSKHGQTGMHLDASFYGQQAMMLDPSGCLRMLSKGQVATGVWLGLPASDETSYSDRND